MTKFFKRNWQLLSICLISLVIFFPSLSRFYTNDDFFFLKIAKVSSLSGFISFFNLFKDTANIGAYRPLTLRVYYFLSVMFFHSSPLPLRIISFITFFADIYLVGKLSNLLTKNNKIAVISLFLYAVSATHFGQLYYVGMFQELCVTFFFLLSVIFFVRCELDNKSSIIVTVYSFVFFILALLSKETAVMIPFAFVAIYFYLLTAKRIDLSIRKIAIKILPFVFVLIAYLFLHFYYFGVLAGDSYVWNFSLAKLANTVTWYGVWSLGIPEMFVDFFGPGLHVNPNLFLYWSLQVIPILILFISECVLLIYMFIKTRNSKKYIILLFGGLWFLITLLPVAFLPIHKFSYYLTLPLVGMVILISYLVSYQKKIIGCLFCGVWFAISLVNLNLAYKPTG